MMKKTGFHGDCFVILVAMTLKLPLTSIEKIGNLHLFLCHCRYLDKRVCLRALLQYKALDAVLYKGPFLRTGMA